MDLSALTPVRIVELLSKHVHGQQEAKEALALTIRNRWRRLQLPPEIRDKVKKSNLLLKGPTGSGKTALVRAVEKELGWPVHFVDITQYSETGYKGKDLDDIIRNFVEKYADRPLPEWYKVKVNEAPSTTPRNTRKDDSSLVMASPSKLAKLYGTAFWLHVCARYQPVPFPSNNPDVTLEDGSTIPYFELFEDIKQNYPQTLGQALLIFRECEMAYPELSDVKGGNLTQQQIDCYNNLHDHTADEIHTDDIRKKLSNDVGVTVETKVDYVRFASQLVDRLSIAEAIRFYQADMLEEMEVRSGPHSLWWLWGSVMYDILIRKGAWKPLRSTARIDTKRLNAKVRKAFCGMYGFTKDEMDRCDVLGDVWVLALSREKKEGQEQSPFEKTLDYIVECAARRLVSPTWVTHAPHRAVITAFIDPVGEGAPKPWDGAGWVDSIQNKIGMLRKFLRDNDENYTVKRDPLKVWDDYVETLRRELASLSTLYPTVVYDFTGSRPKRPQRSGHWNEVSDDPFDVQNLVRAAMNKHFGREEEEFFSNLQGQMAPDKESVIRFIQDYGICFLDEIDKIGIDGSEQAMITRDGVQRGLLALVEGAEYPIKSANKFSDAVEYTFDTTNLMFVGAGAFSVMPLDALIPELRGRFPVVSNIHPLSKEDYIAILKLPESQVYYAKEMLKVESVAVDITDDGYAAMADVCLLMNQHANLGARRLESVVDRVFHEASMEPEKFTESGFTVNKDYVLGLDWSGTDLVIKFNNPDDTSKPIPVASN